MAHELEFVNGQASMAYRSSKGKPWHGLGVPVSDDMTPVEMMKAANLDWTVQKVPTFAKYEEEGQEPLFIETGDQALVRDFDKKVLTTVGSGWNPVQNIEAFEFFHDFVKEGRMVMDTAGSLRGGTMVWALADLKEDFQLFGKDEMKGFLLFSNPHQYGKTVSVRFCLERVVCANTLAVAMNEVGQPSVNVSHRSYFDANKVQQILGLSKNKIEDFKEKAEFLGTRRTTRDDLIRYFGNIFGTDKETGELSRTAENAMSYLQSQPGAEIKEGSYWSAFNCVTYYLDHKAGRSSDTRMASSWFGPNAKKKLDALNLALEMSN